MHQKCGTALCRLWEGPPCSQQLLGNSETYAHILFHVMIFVQYIIFLKLNLIFFIFLQQDFLNFISNCYYVICSEFGIFTCFALHSKNPLKFYILERYIFHLFPVQYTLTAWFFRMRKVFFSHFSNLDNITSSTYNMIFFKKTSQTLHNQC